MDDFDKPAFTGMLTDTAAMYEKTLTLGLTEMWFRDLRRFSLEAVQEAFERHRQNPDAGKWMPRPADLVAMLAGRTVDQASIAWSKVEGAVRCVSPYEDVVFDDPTIHVVISDMGGWIKLCATPSDHDLVFVGKEFVTRYQGYRLRNELPTDFPRVLTGQASAANGRMGIAYKKPPEMIGDRARCLRVYHRGGDAVTVKLTRMADMNAFEKLLPNNPTPAPRNVIAHRKPPQKD